MHPGTGEPWVEFEEPFEVLGYFLTGERNTLRLEALLARLAGDPQGRGGGQESFVERSGESVRIWGDWGDDELVAPYPLFRAAAQAYLDWIRSQPPPEPDDFFVVAALWLAGTITLDEAAVRRKMHLRFPGAAPDAVRVTTEAHLLTLLDRYVPGEDQARLEHVAGALASFIANGALDPRAGAAAIAELAAALERSDTFYARLMHPFPELTARAVAALGDPVAVARLERQIDAAAQALASRWRADRRP